MTLTKKHMEILQSAVGTTLAHFRFPQDTDLAKQAIDANMEAHKLLLELSGENPELESTVMDLFRNILNVRRFN